MTKQQRKILIKIIIDCCLDILFLNHIGIIIRVYPDWLQKC